MKCNSVETWPKVTHFCKTIFIPITFVYFLCDSIQYRFPLTGFFFSFPQSYIFDDFFNGFIERLQGEISFFLMGMKFSTSKVEGMILTHKEVKIPNFHSNGLDRYTIDHYLYIFREDRTFVRTEITRFVMPALESESHTQII